MASRMRAETKPGGMNRNRLAADNADSTQRRNGAFQRDNAKARRREDAKRPFNLAPWRLRVLALRPAHARE